MAAVAGSGLTMVSMQSGTAARAVAGSSLVMVSTQGSAYFHGVPGSALPVQNVQTVQVRLFNQGLAT